MFAGWHVVDDDVLNATCDATAATGILVKNPTKSKNFLHKIYAFSKNECCQRLFYADATLNGHNKKRTIFFRAIVRRFFRFDHRVSRGSFEIDMKRPHKINVGHIHFLKMHIFWPPSISQDFLPYTILCKCTCVCWPCSNKYKMEICTSILIKWTH